MNRPCDRSGCADPAAASLGFDYQLRTAWLVASTQPHPATYGLCQRHADELRVPLGWTLQDERSSESPAPRQALGAP